MTASNRFEEARLQSFQNWPLSYVEPAELAAAGFYYVGVDDRVKCFECGVEIHEWMEGDLPMVDHKHWTRRCRFLEKEDCGNVPIGVDPNTVLPPRSRGRDVCGPYDLEYRPMSAPDNQNFSTELQFPSTAELSYLGLGKHKVAVRPQYKEDNIDYRFEEARLQSFQNWPLSYMEPAKLAAAGFYYVGVDDRVKCFECGVEIYEWVEGDLPMVDHKRWSRRCRFLEKEDCGNVPIGVDPNTVLPPRPRGRDVCGLYNLGYRSAPDDQNFSTELQLPSAAKLSYLGLGKHGIAVHPHYASYDTRLQTFETWPISLSQTKEQLANAGFYYTGNGDRTLCYHCGGGLKDWGKDDDPWEEHAKWFSKCYYLLLIKGQDYVSKVTGQHIPPSIEETRQMLLPKCITKVPPSLETKEKQIGEKGEMVCYPGSSNSQDSSIHSIGSSAQLMKATTEDLSENMMATASTSSSKRTDDARMCKICYNEELGVIFLPCGHVATCVNCAVNMITCAVCRVPISMTARAFLP